MRGRIRRLRQTRRIIAVKSRALADCVASHSRSAIGALAAGVAGQLSDETEAAVLPLMGTRPGFFGVPVAVIRADK
jgi:hypothetical protein